jgi:hypothetical protein
MGRDPAALSCANEQSLSSPERWWCRLRSWFLLYAVQMAYAVTLMVLEPVSPVVTTPMPVHTVVEVGCESVKADR